jgi:dTDP-4-dehydrorhamnose 3,5-epimerase
MNKRQLVDPKGFAHGYCTLIPNTNVLVKVDEYLSPVHDRGIIWCDPDLKIDWRTSNPIVSEKDKNLPLLKDIEHNFIDEKKENTLWKLS